MMWLIDTDSYRLVEVNGPGDHPYAILSHTWDKTGEVTFSDMNNLELAKAKAGWAKVEHTCALARTHHIKFAWIDTCCIDKSSSAELTEAINSMFEWYKRAKVCYAYLADLPACPNGINPESPAARQQLRAGLDGCLWFRRGWTLQELIAPKALEFYDCSWTKRGSKTLLGSEISRITHIGKEVLLSEVSLSTIPVARKMSWAAKRQTTRAEDIAYSLLGIFDVNLPLIYGEGKKAFIRLQEAIAHSTNDLSLFAWLEDSPNEHQQPYHGVLAKSPEQFAGCRHIAHIRDPLRHDNQSFTITNRGVEFHTSLNMVSERGDYLMHLYCKDTSYQRPAGTRGMIAIRLVKISSGFARHSISAMVVDDKEVAGNTWDQSTRPVHVPKHISLAESVHVAGRFNGAFRFQVETPHGVKWQMVTHDPNTPIAERDPVSTRPSYWDPAASAFLTDDYENFTGMLYISFSMDPSQHVVVLCGLMALPSTKHAAASTKSRVIPWVTVYAPPPINSTNYSKTPTPKVDSQGRAISDLGNIIRVAKEAHLHYPHFLSYLGRKIRGKILAGEILPSKGGPLEYREEVRRPAKSEGYNSGRSVPLHHFVTVSGMSRKLSGGYRHDINISLSKQQTEAAELPKLNSARPATKEEMFQNFEVEWLEGPVQKLVVL